ncbi:MAG: helix-turn-helix domain-containing protein [Actinomycetota bacterium]|jgi:transcriptional regulator with XRE-family HTH domain
MSSHMKWGEVSRPTRGQGDAVLEDEERISQFRELVYRLRIEAGLTQVELADRMGTVQPAIARMENGGVRPTLDTLEKLAKAVGKDLVVGIGEGLQENRAINKMVRDGHAVVRPAI